MGDLLNSNCGQTLLKLVSKGNAIIAELLKLSDMIPSVFRIDSKNMNPANDKYMQLICDFGQYFKDGIDFEAEFNKRLDSNPSLAEFDDDFRENFIGIISRFYLAFESVHRYSVDLNHFIDDVENDMYIQQSLESLLMDPDGKQLLCESLFVLGIMLFVIDGKIDGLVRERILVSYYRYSSSASHESNIDDVCSLIRSTGLNSSSKKPTNYPEEYFKRPRINLSFVNQLIGKLRTDDIYNMSTISFPSPDHRTVALANQASILYVILFFQPEILHSSNSIMREIVDKFFNDNWIISLYIGLDTINLINEWNDFKAAKAALNNVLELSNVKKLASSFGSQVKVKIIPEIRRLLKEGTMTQQYVLQNMSNIMKIIREANVSLRWLMLHTTPPIGHSSSSPSTSITSHSFSNLILESKKSKQVRDMVSYEAKIEPLELFTLLLLTAELELKVRDLYQELLRSKSDNWIRYKKESYERVLELSEVFSGTKPLTRIDPNPKLESWFKQVADSINSLDNDQEMRISSKKIVTMITSLEEVCELHNLDSNLQVKQYVIDIRQFLSLMLKLMAIKDDVLIKLDIIADLTYSWSLIDHFTPHMQDGIQKEPSLVSRLRATFLKLSSTIDFPLNRLTQSSSPDLLEVSSYFSSELVNYVRKVLHIIPESMFKLMDQVIQLETHSIREMPTRVMKEDLKSYSQLENRFQVAKLTHSISVLTEGLLMMKKTLVGVIEIDPKKLLEDGIRKELVKQVTYALHNNLVFNTKSKNQPDTLVSKLKLLNQVMDGFRRSFNYIQDYLQIYGLKLFLEELSRIVHFNIEQECNSFMRIKILDMDSMYQSKSIPIPKFPPIDPYSVNFIGRLTRELLRITDPKTTIYVHSIACWYDSKTHAEVVNPKLFTLIMKSLGTSGLNGVDKLLSFMIHLELVNVRKYLDRNVTKDRSWFDSLNIAHEMFNPESNSKPANLVKVISMLSERAGKSWNSVIDAISRIGQMQILRIVIGHEINMACKFQSRHLAATLQTFNESLLNEITAKSSTLSLTEDSPLLFELSNYLEFTGFSDAMSKIYVGNDKPIALLDMILLVITNVQVSRVIFNKITHGLAGRKSADIADGTPFIFGFVTLSKQSHINVIHDYLSKSCWYINCLVATNQDNTNILSPDVTNYLLFLDEITRLGKLSRGYLSTLPPTLIDHCKSSLI